MNSSISFDAAENRPSDYEYVFKPVDLEGVERQRKGYGSVYYNGKFVVAMDRGAIPEFKIWDTEDGVQPIPMSDIEKYDDTKVTYVQILPSDPFYNDALLKAQRADDNYKIAPDGKVFRYEAFRFAKVRGQVISLGWRHTFEALVRCNIPGINRTTLGGKFGVDMNKFPLGDPEDIRAALHEE